MILEGNERGYGLDLAKHLMNPLDNDHVTVHAVDGFISDDLAGAFSEVEAISQATQCSKYLFSLSLNPPPNETVSVEAFESAISDVERKLGLMGQPRAIVFHEKKGRRHAHCVWSRINTRDMKAITLSHYKRKLGDVTRELFRQHNWNMPAGLKDQSTRDPLNYSREEAGQAKRLRRDPKELKSRFQSCWERSDSLSSFRAALKEDGYLIARGDRRGFVAVDADGKVWSLSRWCGVSPRELRTRLGSEDQLPTINDILADTTNLPTPLRRVSDAAFDLKRAELVAQQRQDRTELLKKQEQRRMRELIARHAQRPRGVRALFARLTGQYETQRLKFEKDAAEGATRDRSEQQALVEKHLSERRALQDLAQRAGVSKAFKSAIRRDPRQTLEIAPDGLPFTLADVKRRPELILSQISKTKAQFERIDVLRELAKCTDDPLLLRDIADKALLTSQAVRLESGSTPRYTTRDYLDAEARLDSVAKKLRAGAGFNVSQLNITNAIRAQNAEMKKAFGGGLSQEQCSALDYIQGGEQLACVVGLAGAGKSTLLKTAMDAWLAQGVTVHGAALAGKAADGLEEASNIPSRTLASLETSWENGYEPIKQHEVLVVDEAGMVGTRQLERVASKIKDIGAKLVLVGDPEQLQPIEAGQPFKELVRTHDAARLTEIHRQRHDWQKQASYDLAQGKIDKALNNYKDQNCVHRNPNSDQAIEALVETYVMDTIANRNSTRLALAHRRKDVHALNQAIRTAIRDNEEQPSPDVLLKTNTGKRAFAKGDRIVFGRNDRDLGVKNGMLGTVEKVSESKMVVAVDGDCPQQVTFNPNVYQAFDHGYAVTIHKSQGVTVDSAYVLASRSMDRHLAYVAMTRHRDQMHLYINERDKPVWSLAQDAQDLSRQYEQDRRLGPSMG